MKQFLSCLLLTALTAAMLCSFCVAIAEPEEDYSVEGWYEVLSIIPEDHDYSYIYDQPSSTKGKNLGRVDDGEMVYVYFKTHGLGRKRSQWAYCEYNGISGYIRYDNLVFMGSYDSYDDYEYDDYAFMRFIDSSGNSYEDESYAYVGSMMINDEDGPVALRDEPAWTTNWTVEAPPNSIVDVYYYDEIWAYCCYNGNYGYILWEDLTDF